MPTETERKRSMYYFRSRLNYTGLFVIVLFFIEALFFTEPIVANEKVRLQLKWDHQFQFAGYYAAVEKGFYSAAGLDVEILPAQPGTDALQEVLKGNADFGVGTTDLLLMQDNGNPFVVLAVIFQHSPSAFMVLKNSTIQSIHDLAHHTIMIEENSAELKAYLKSEHITDITILPHTFNVKELTSGQVDAISVYVTDEPFEVKRMKKDYMLYSPRAAGIDFYGDNLFTTATLIKENPALVKKFREASLLGWEYAMRHKEEIIQLLYNKYSTRHSIDHLRFEADKMESLLQPSLIEIGHMNPGRWKNIAEVYASLGMINGDPDLSKLLYDPTPPPVKVTRLYVLLFGIAVLLLIATITAVRFARLSRALRESDNKYRTVVEKSTEAIIIAQDGTFAFANDRMSELLGVPIEDLLGKQFADFIWPEDKEYVFSNYKKRIAGEPVNDAYDFRIIGANNKLLWVFLSATTLSWKGRPATLNLLTDITQRKQIEHALRESEEKHRQLIENSHDIIYTLTADGLLTFVSPAWTSLLGYQIDHVVGQSFTVFVHPEDIPECMIWLQKVVSTGQRQEGIDYRVQHIDGTWYWHTSSAVPAKNEAGIVIGLEGIARDITEKKMMETLLKQTHQNYETFFNTIDDFLFVLDEQGSIIYTNATVLDRLGYTKDELCGKSILMVHPPERRDEAGRIVGEMLRGNVDFCPVPVITKSGMQIPVETRVSHGVWDAKPVIFGVTKDISKLKLSEEKFSKLFYINPSACGLSDIDTHQYVEVNDAFYVLLGFNEKEVLGKTALELGILPENTRDAILQKTDKNGNITNVETILKAKNGDLKHVLLSATNIFVQDKKYRFTIVNDISEQKKNEETIRAFNATLEKHVAERTQELQDAYSEMEAFTYSVAHDLRSPLRSIDGFSQVLHDDYKEQLDNEGKRIIDIVRANTQKMDHLILDLLSLSHISKNELTFSSINMNSLVKTTFGELTENNEDTFTLELGNLPKSYGDTLLIKQVLYNLISNALKYSQKSSTKHIEIGSFTENNEHVYFVKDHGAGFNSVYAHKLFGVFQRLHTNNEFEGTGIGLSIVKRIITRHKGRVWAQGKENEGATFYFSLPIEPEIKT